MLHLYPLAIRVSYQPRISDKSGRGRLLVPESAKQTEQLRLHCEVTSIKAAHVCCR